MLNRSTLYIHLCSIITQLQITTSKHIFPFCFMYNLSLRTPIFEIISFHKSLLLSYRPLKRTHTKKKPAIGCFSMPVSWNMELLLTVNSKCCVSAIRPFPLWLNIRSKTAFSCSFIVLLNITFQVLRPMSTVVHGLLKIYEQNQHYTCMMKQKIICEFITKLVFSCSANQNKKKNTTLQYTLKEKRRKKAGCCKFTSAF